jgi:dTDP-4-amino-4,6-dideoxygalactose transaminase
MGLYDDVHLPETERAVAEVLSLPIHPLLTEDERDYIVETVNAAL